MTDSYATIRDMCREFGVTPRTLRFYEAKELLFPVRQGTRRLFTRCDRARMKLILQGKRFGFSLEEIRQLLDLYDPAQNNLPQMERAFELGNRRLEDMICQRDDLSRLIGELREQLALGEKMIGEIREKQMTAA